MEYNKEAIKTGFFGLSRLKFYSTLFIASILVLGAGVLFIKSQSDCSEMECLVVAQYIFGLAKVIYGITLLANVVLMLAYEKKITIDRNKNKFIIFIHFILLLSIVFGPLTFLTIKDKIWQAKVQREEAQHLERVNIFKSFLKNNDLEGCIKTFNTNSDGTFVADAADATSEDRFFDCAYQFAYSRKDVSLCRDNDNDCVTEITMSIAEERDAMRRYNKLMSLCREKIDINEQQACVDSLLRMYQDSGYR